MYLSTRSLAAAGRPGTTDDGVAAAHDPAGGGSGRNVVFLGLTSMFTDVSAEMVASVLPLYLTLFFGFGPLQFGVFDGAYQAFTALAAIAAAVGADRARRHKLAAGAGYALSALCTIGLSAARGTWEVTVGLLYLTRLGKGVRTAPRDALIAMSVTPDRLGRAFGVHRAFDTVGAVAGPVLASLLLGRDPAGYGTVFAVGFLVAVLGVAAFVLLVESPRQDGTAGAAAGGAGESRADRLRRRAAAAVRLHPFRSVLVAGVSLALVRPGDAQVFLAFTRDGGLGTAGFPLLYSAASMTFLLAATPLGLLADRIGKLRVFVIGELAVAGVLIVVASGQRGTAALVALLVLLGVSYAATDGVLAALASSALPPRWRTTGLAVLAAAIAAGRFGASVAFGALWERGGGPAAARMFVPAVAVTIVVGIVLARREAGRRDGGEPAPSNRSGDRRGAT